MVVPCAVCVSVCVSVASFFFCRLYRQLGGRKWVWNAITTSLVFPLPLLAVFSVVNTIAIFQVLSCTCDVLSLLVPQGRKLTNGTRQ